MRFIAAVPNYNHGASAVELVNQLLDEDFDQVLVIDDASTDDSLERLRALKDQRLHIVEGKDNLGAGGNRNRAIPYMQTGDLVMFVDADMILKSRNFRLVAQRLFEENNYVALIGCGILDKSGKPMTYNYGIHQSQFRHGIGLLFENIAKLLHFRPLIQLIRPFARQFTYNLEIRYFKPIPRRVDSVSEGHFYVRADVFKRLKGFNKELRYHEGAEFALRLRQAGHGVLFSPALWTQHLQIHSRESIRMQEIKKLERIISNNNTPPKNNL